MTLWSMTFSRIKVKRVSGSGFDLVLKEAKGFDELQICQSDDPIVDDSGNAIDHIIIIIIVSSEQ